jgi:flagellar basal body-associated protein FliL
MKKNEIAILLIVVGLVVMGTYSIINMLFGTSALKPVDVEKAEAIQASIVTPDQKVFNKDALNPAVTITIGNQSNQQPFTVER